MTQFFSQINKLDLDQKSFLSPDYYFYAGFASPTYISTSKGLSLIFETFEMLFKMAKANIIADTQMEKVFQAILINSKIRVERELNRLLSTDPLEDIVQPEVYPKNSIELFGKVKTLLVHYGNNPPHILEPLDLALWGFLCSYAPDLHSDLFEKILSLRKQESSGAINKDQKLRMYELLYSIIVTNIQEYFENLDEKHFLALKSPSTSADSDEQNIVELFSEQEIDIQAKEEFKEKIEMGECRICLEVLETQAKLEICRHSFHIICLEEYAKAQMNENKFPILCPEEHCKAELTNSDLGRILKAEDLQNFYRLSVTHLLNKNTNVVFHCPTPNCAFKLFYAEPSQKEVKCPLCYNTFCLACKEHCHPNAPCEVNQFIKVARDLGLKACPTCRHWVERTEGCNHMTCNCGYEFCYQCGRIYDSVQADYGGYACAEGYCQEDEYYNDFEKLLSLQEGE